MTKNFLKIAFIIFIITSFLSACTKDNDPKGNGDSRKIKYEITGNFSGKLMIIYSDNVNQITQVNDVTLPWSLDVQYGSNVMTIGIGGQASVMGNPGQTATVKIYSNGTVVKTSSATADVRGGLVLPTIAHGF